MDSYRGREDRRKKEFEAAVPAGVHVVVTHFGYDVSIIPVAP
jgi:hypothetical protein